MSIKFVKVAAIALASALTVSSGLALAEGEPQSLEQLLQFVKKGQVTEGKENAAREQRFAKDKANQAAELKKMEAERTRQEGLSAQLEDTFEENELLVPLWSPGSEISLTSTPARASHVRVPSIPPAIVP